MSLISTIEHELETMTTGVGRAMEMTSEAGIAAAEVGSRAAASGFTGMVQRMAHVRDAIQHLRGQLAVIGRSINGARALVDRAPDQMSPQDTINVLAPVGEEVAVIRAAIDAAVAKVDQLHHQVVHVLHGGQPEPMLRRLAAIRQLLLAVAQRGHNVTQQLDTVLAEVQQIGAAGNAYGVPMYQRRDHRHPRPPTYPPARRKQARRSATPGAGSYHPVYSASQVVSTPPILNTPAASTTGPTGPRSSLRSTPTGWCSPMTASPTSRPMPRRTRRWSPTSQGTTRPTRPRPTGRRGWRKPPTATPGIITRTQRRCCWFQRISIEPFDTRVASVS